MPIKLLYEAEGMKVTAEVGNTIAGDWFSSFLEDVVAGI